MATHNKREAERVPILGALQGEIMAFQPMLIRQITANGLTIETSVPLRLNSLHDIRLGLGSRTLVIKGRVVHEYVSEMDHEIVTYRSGIEFVEPSDGARGVITEFIESLKSSRAKRQAPS